MNKNIIIIHKFWYIFVIGILLVILWYLWFTNKLNFIQYFKQKSHVILTNIPPPDITPNIINDYEHLICSDKLTNNDLKLVKIDTINTFIVEKNIRNKIIIVINNGNYNLIISKSDNIIYDEYIKIYIENNFILIKHNESQKERYIMYQTNKKYIILQNDTYIYLLLERKKDNKKIFIL